MAFQSPKSTTWSPPPHSRASTDETPPMSPSSILRSTTASIQKPPLMIVGHPSARDTPGPSPDETNRRKTYAAILTSEAASSGPLGITDEAWPPLVSMAPDHPPETFVKAQDRVPPDLRQHGRTHPPSLAPSSPPCKRRRRRHTRRKRNSPPTQPTMINSDDDLFASLSSIVDTIQTDALAHLRNVLCDRFRSEMDRHTASLHSALARAITHHQSYLRKEVHKIELAQLKFFSQIRSSLRPSAKRRQVCGQSDSSLRTRKHSVHGSDTVVDDSVLDISERLVFPKDCRFFDEIPREDFQKPEPFEELPEMTIFDEDGTPNLSALCDLLQDVASLEDRFVLDEDEHEEICCISLDEFEYDSLGENSLCHEDGDY